jgi:hypothetical protein
MSELANQMDLGAFVAHLLQHMPHQVSDVQVNLLVNGGVHDHNLGPRNLEQATQTMLRTSFLGVVDCLKKSLVAGQHFLNPVFPNLDCTPTAVNVSKGLDGTLEDRTLRLRNACGPQLYAELIRRNTLELELVSRARAEVERRFRLAKNQAA